MTVVEILDVILDESNAEWLWGCYVDKPTPKSRSAVYAIDIAGWVLSRDSSAVAVEVSSNDTVLRRVPIDVLRPDIAIAYPEVLGAEYSGFRTTLGLLRTTTEYELKLQAVLQDNRRIPIGVIRGRRRPLNGDFRPDLQPLMLTSVGRTGTTWLMGLLASHPHVVAYRQHPYELRIGRYWMHMLRVLSEPANHYESASFDDLRGNPYYIGHNPYYSPPLIDNPQLRHWFGRIYVEQLAAFCQRSIEECYQQIAASQHQLKPVYFIEKHIPDSIPLLTWELYPRAREIILVRDFRDVICSVFTFNARRGYASFGRETVDTDEDYVQEVRNYALQLLGNYKSRASQAHLLRYEDLVLRPVETLSNLLEYLNLDSSLQTIEEMIQSVSEETSSVRQHRTSSSAERSIGRWRHDLDPSLQEVCQEALGDVLAEFGYVH